MVKFTLLICLTLVAYGKSSPVADTSDDQIIFDSKTIASFYIAVNAGIKEAVKTYDEVLTEEMKDSVKKLGRPVLIAYLFVPRIYESSLKNKTTTKKEEYRNLARIIETSLDNKARTDLNKYVTLLDNLGEIIVINYKLFVYHRAAFEQYLNESLTQSEQKFFKKLIADSKFHWDKADDDNVNIWEHYHSLMKNQFNQILELKDKLKIIYDKIQEKSKEEN